MKKFLLDLDSLLDTRLGLISVLDPGVAMKLVLKPDYWAREQDDWTRLTDGVITTEQFQAAWETRDKDILKASVMTGILPVLLQLLGQYNHMVREGQIQEDAGVEINLYPYDLELDELEELESILRQALYRDVSVTFCSRPLEELTPEVLRDQYFTIILYEFHRWIKLHYTTLPNSPCREVSLVGPRLFERDPRQLGIERKQEEVMSLRLWFLEFIDLDLIDIKWFSMFRPDVPAT